MSKFFLNLWNILNNASKYCFWRQVIFQAKNDENYLISTINQDRLNSLIIMLIESEDAGKIDFPIILEEVTKP